MAVDIKTWQRHAAIKIKGNGVANFASSRILLQVAAFPEEAMNAGSNSAQNGGGDLRFSLDAYGIYELRCDVVEFVTNATPGNRKAQVWVRLPSWPQNDDTIIYVWYKTSTTESQPPAHGDYGTEKTWSFQHNVYHMEEASGQIDDRCVQRNNLNRNGPSQSTTAKVGSYSQEFNSGESDYFQQASNIGISGATARTISFWVRLKDTNRCGMVIWGSNANSCRFGMSIRNGNWYFWGYGSGRDWDTGVSPSINTWYHVVVTYDGSTAIEVYINGSRLGSGHTLPEALNTTNSPLTIGWEDDGGSQTYLNGFIDAVRVYDGETFNQNQITAVYNSENAPDDLVYRMKAEPVPAGELNAGGWQKQAPIALAMSGASSNQSDVRVVLDRFCFPEEMMDAGSDSALNGGGDVRFSLDRYGLQPIPAEIRWFQTHATPSSRRIEVWLKLPQWRNDIGTEIWTWWKHPTITAQPSGYSDSGRFQVWDENYAGVWHMFDGVNPIDNESQYLLDGTGVGNLPNYADGKIDRCQDLNGSTDYMTVPDHHMLQPGTGNFTVSLWFNVDNLSSTRQLFSKRYSNGPDGNLEAQIASDGKLRVYCEGGSGTDYFDSSATISTGTWYHAVITRSGTTVSLYLQGVYDNSMTSGRDVTADGELMYVGSDRGGAEYFDGLIDDFQYIKGVALSADTIKAMYNNQNSPTTYFTPGEMIDVDLFHGYLKEQTMEIQSTYVDAVLTDFPVLLTQANLPSEIFAGATRCREDGGDIAFGSTDGRTRYPCDIAYLNVSSSLAEIHVRIPSVASGSNTQFKIYWKKPGQKLPGVNNWYGRKKTWDRHYLFVLHANEADLDGSQVADYFMDEEFLPMWTDTPGAGQMEADFGSPQNGVISGAAQGNDSQLFDESYTGSWTIEVHGVGGGSNSHGIRMIGDGGTTIEAFADGTTLYAKCTGQTDHSQSDPFSGRKEWLRIVYDSSAQTLTFYYSTNSNLAAESSPDPWTQYKQYTSINLGSEKFAPELNNSGGDWRYIKITGSAGTPQLLIDSTRYGEHFFCNGSLPTQIDGQVYKGQDLNGSSDYVSRSSGLKINGCSLTFENYAKRGDLTSGYHMSQGSVGSTRKRLHWGFRNADKYTLAFWSDDLDTSGNYQDTTNFIHWAGTFILSSLEQRIYKDGASENYRTAGGSLDTDGPFEIGRRTDGGDFFDGILDEVRLSRINRSAAYIKATYNTLKAPNTFCPKSGSVSTRRVIGKLAQAGSRLVNLHYGNLVHTGQGTNATQWRNNGTELGTFDPFDANIPNKEDWRGWDACEFVGNEAYESSFATPASLLGDPDFTIEVWAFIQETDDENAAVQTGKRGVAGQNCSLNLGHNPTWGAASFFSNDIAYSPSDILALENFDWHHVVLVRRTSIDRTFIYVDGVLNNIKDHSISITSNGNIFVGGALNSAGSGLDNPLDGYLRHVRIYNGALTEAEIIKNFHLGMDCQAQVKGLLGGGLVNPPLINGGLV